MDTTQFHRIAKALADPRRFKILETIAAAGNELCCGEVAECFPVAQATISHHLKELTDAHLIETRAEGQFKYLRVRPDILTDYITELERRIGPLAGRRREAKGAKLQKSAKYS